MTIFTKLSLFFFAAFAVVSVVPLLTDKVAPEQTWILGQVAVCLVMVNYILDMVFRGKSRTALESEALANMQKAAAEAEQSAAVKAKEAEWTAVLKAKEARIHELEAKLKKADEGSPDQAVVQFLRTLQSKGRLIDFAMTDIHRIPDPQVGAVARIVHQGVRELLQDYFEIVPVASEEEGSFVKVAGELPVSYRVLQDGSDGPVSSGRLVHRGWQTLSRRLPHSVQKETEDKLRVLAPAEIDARTNA